VAFEVAFEVAVEVVVVGRHAGFTTGAKLPDREHVVVRRLVLLLVLLLVRRLVLLLIRVFFKKNLKKKYENTCQNSARMVRFGIAIESVPREPIFENVLIFEKKGGC
jgi:hypothetical protein